MKIDTSKLVTAEQLRELLWSDDCRPCLRSIYNWQKARILPYYKIRSRVYFNPDEVREALEKKCKVRAL